MSSTGTALTSRAVKGSDDMAEAESTTGKSPAFQFYQADFVSGTLTFTTEEVGAYILLMCHCWDKGLIPSDLRLIARIARLSPQRMRSTWAALSSKFIAVEGGLIQPRLERERAKQQLWREKSAAGGRNTQAKRKSGSTTVPTKELSTVEPEGQPNANSSVFGLLSSSSVIPQRAVESVPTVPKSLSDRAKYFMDFYESEHEKVIGFGYLSTNPQKDDSVVLALCDQHDDETLRDAVYIWLGMKDDFAMQGNRTLTKFASRIAECIQRARKVTA